MKKILLSLIMLCCMVIAKAQTQPNNEIWYTSSDGNVVTPNNAKFNVSIESNEYKDGKGVIIFSGELTNIGVSAFSGKMTLTSVTIPASVTSIGESAFSGTQITAVTIPASVTSIKSNAFSGCKSLATLTFAEGSQLGTIGNDAFNGTAISGELTLPASLKIIGEYAFRGTQITAVTIPASVTSIEKSAFSETQITAVTIPASVTSIGVYAFYNCSQLSTLTIAEGSQLKTIGDYAFNGTAISGELTLPATLKTLGVNAFYECQLSNVYMSSENLSGFAKNGLNKDAVIIVPLPLYETYKSYFVYNKVHAPLDEWKLYNKGLIEAAMKTVNTLSDTDSNTIAGFISTIENTTSFDEVTSTCNAALALIDQQKAFEEKVKGVLEDLGTRQNGPAVRITDKDGRSFILYSPKSVEYIKVKEE